MKNIINWLLPFWIIIFNFQFCFASRALLIGVNDYKALSGLPWSGWCDLKGAENDVKAMKKALCSHYGFFEHEIRVLLNKEAKREAIESAVTQWLVRDTKQDDLVVIYFAGHGSTVRDYNNDENDGYDEVLCPYDMDPQGGHNIIIDDEMGFWLAGLSGRTVVVIIDSCHSGGIVRGMREKTINLEETPPKQVRFIPIEGYNPPPGAKDVSEGPDIPESVIFITASKENEAAVEILLPEGFYGGFTFGFCDGMQSLLSSSYRDLFNHARKVIKDKFGLSQEPVILGRHDIILKPAFKIKQLTNYLYEKK